MVGELTANSCDYSRMALTTKSGKGVHPIGIGTWNVASRLNSELPEGRYRNVEAVRGNESQEIEGIRYSLGRGQNHIDCAELYGAFYTDEVVGEAIDIEGVERTDLFIADKLWKNSVVAGAARPTVEQMLTKLGTDYLDLLYIHAPFNDADWQAAIPQIDQLIDEGIVRHLGVSNFTVEQMQETSAMAHHPIAANQMNLNCLYTKEVDDAFKKYCNEQDIAIVAYRPLTLEGGVPLRHEVLTDIAAQHGATSAQIALAWLLQIGTLPIPKAIQKSHIDENLEALKILLSDEDMDRLGHMAE